MCYHRYTSHPCGHKSQSLGKCNVDILATQVLFCNNYHVLNDASLTFCGGSYCKEDKETAYWVENGLTLLTACNDDLVDIKYRLQTLHQELTVAAKYRDAFGPQQGKEIDRVRTKHEEYVELRQRGAETRDRRQLILDGIKKAREKQQAVHADKMRRLQQYVNAHKPQSAVAASPQGIPKANHMFEGRRLMKRAESSIWETGDTSATPCRPTTNLLISPFRHTPKFPDSPSLAYSSPPSLATPISLADRTAEVMSSSSPRKKRRGRPPKASQMDDVETQSQIISEVPSRGAQINNDDSPVANNQRPAPKLQTTKRSNKKESPAQRISPAGVRRSGRTKQRVSYAESPSPSPEHSALDQPKRSTRATRAPRNKRMSQQDDVYAIDEDDGGEEDHGFEDDDEWQGGDGNAEDDMDIEPTPVVKARSSTKRTAVSPPGSSRSTKRQAMIAPRNTAHRGSDDGETMDVDAEYELDQGYTYSTIPSTTSKGACDMPSTPQTHNMAIENKSNLLYNAKPTIGPLNPNVLNFQGQNPAGPDMSPLRRSDWLNGLDGADAILSLADIDDPYNYDFDVYAMSKVVANLDAQQG
ncbi:hypothetical protein KCU81_g2475, partial [Aureobasidium melanogenum]|uniref:Uncharacterized protein n=1 Tax=Aureobasidium melanogenum (strain CBS 110374) TaxID=1043003 RepID=A0A074VXZ1_AURM1